MKGIKEFFAWIFLSCVVALIVFVILGVNVVPLFIYAESVAKQQEDGTCVKFATVGIFDQYHCIDPVGNEYNTNTAGMMISVGN